MIFGESVTILLDKNNYVRLAEIETGAENNGFTEVLLVIGYGDKVVVSTDRRLYDGCEVTLSV